MAEKTIKTRIRCKIDTAENWKTNNPVLLVGELGVESDTELIKVGDGTTSWTSLSYLQYLPLTGGQLTGALKIASGSDKGIQSADGDSILYINDNGEVFIRSESGDYIEIGGGSASVQIGGSKILSDVNVIARSFKYNDKAVAVTTDIPTKTSQLNNDSGFIDKNVNDLTNYLPLTGGTLTGTPMVKNNTILSYVNNEDTPIYLLSYSDYLNCIEVGNFGTPVHLIGTETRPKYETSTTEDGGVELALLADIPDTSSFVKLASSSTQTISSPIRFSNDNVQCNKGIQDTSTNNIAGKVANYITLGNNQFKTRIIGSGERPKYATSFSTGTSDLKDLALYSDIKSGIKSYLTSNATTGSGTSGSLQLTLGHLYILYIVDGIHTFRTLVRLGTDSSKTQYWYLGIGAYGHYMRLYILGNGTVTYQYANVGNTNWTDNLSVAIYYDDITGQ